MGNKKVVTVVRSMWSRGVEDNYLLVSAETARTNKQTMKKIKKDYPFEEADPLACKIGGMCCLGFASLAFGATKKQIRDVALPSFIGKDWAEDVGLKEGFCCQASQINDDREITDKERERELIKLCEKHRMPFTFEFVN